MNVFVTHFTNRVILGEKGFQTFFLFCRAVAGKGKLTSEPCLADCAACTVVVKIVHKGGVVNKRWIVEAFCTLLVAQVVFPVVIDVVFVDITQLCL